MGGKKKGGKKKDGAGGAGADGDQKQECKQQ